MGALVLPRGDAVRRHLPMWARGDCGALHISMNTLLETCGCLTAWDDVAGTCLDAEGVRKARQVDIQLFHGMNAVTRCSHGCVTDKGTIIDLKCIDANKRDVANPEVQIPACGV